MITIVIVNWNGYKDTIECLESLIRLDYNDFNIIIVDNGSSDGSIGHIEEWARSPYFKKPCGAPWSLIDGERKRVVSYQVVKNDSIKSNESNYLITIIDTGINLGFAGANNVGMRWAFVNSDVEYVWLLNNDTVVESSSLGILFDKIKMDENLGILGSCLLYYDKPNTIQALGGFYNYWLGRGGHIATGIDVRSPIPSAEKYKKLTYIIGASMLVRRSLFEEFGGMSEKYFLYFEEIDWAHRIKASYKQDVENRAIVYHKEGSSIGTSAHGRGSDTSIYYLTVNSFRWAAKFVPWILPMIFIRHLKDLIKFALCGDWRAIEVKLEAFTDFLFLKYKRGPYGHWL